MWDISSREDAIDYANKHGISVPVTKEKIYSRDQNLWHISHEGGDIEDLTTEHQEDILYLMTTSPEKAKNDPTYVEISFEKGWPVKVDGKALAPVELLETLNKTDSICSRIVAAEKRSCTYAKPPAPIFTARAPSFNRSATSLLSCSSFSGSNITPAPAASTIRAASPRIPQSTALPQAM